MCVVDNLQRLRLQSPDKFTGKRRTQIYVYVYIYMRSWFRSARLGWRRPPSRRNSSIPKKTRIPVGQPIQIRIRDRLPRRLRRRQLRQPAPPRPNKNIPSRRGGGGDFLVFPPPCCAGGGGGYEEVASTPPRGGEILIGTGRGWLP